MNYSWGLEKFRVGVFSYDWVKFYLMIFLLKFNYDLDIINKVIVWGIGKYYRGGFSEKYIFRIEV